LKKNSSGFYYSAYVQGITCKLKNEKNIDIIDISQFIPELMRGVFAKRRTKEL